ncbi:MAG TPA: MEDS domain-containing protein [Conexibacter sp.]|nr:MEDS domain-containing protein [Conexibacter sp.]
MLDRRDELPGDADARASRAVAGIGAGDHACCAYCAAEDQRGLVRRFAADALDGGMRLLYLLHDNTEDAVLACLAAAGVDVGGRRAAGQLELGSAAKAYCADGRFDPERQIGRLAERAASARGAGWAGLAVTTEMGWALDTRADPELLVAYERTIGQTFAADGGIAALCQYDALAFPDALRRRIADAHTLAIATGPAGTVTTRGPAKVAEMTGVDGLQLAGEIDAFSAPYVRARIGEHLAGGRDVVLDLAELTFADVGASRTFVEMAESLDPDLRIVLEGSPPVLRRVLRLCQWGERPGLVVRDDAIVLDPAASASAFDADAPDAGAADVGAPA